MGRKSRKARRAFFKGIQKSLEEKRAREAAAGEPKPPMRENTSIAAWNHYLANVGLAVIEAGNPTGLSKDQRRNCRGKARQPWRAKPF